MSNIHTQRGVVTAAMVFLFVTAAPQAASAQAAPSAPSTSPAPAVVVAPDGGLPPRRTSNPLTGRLPIIDLVIDYTEPAEYNRSSQIKGYDGLDIGGSMKFPISKTFSVAFDRIVGGLNQPAERVIQRGISTYPNNSRDVMLVYRADWQIKRFVIEGGQSFRHRLFNGGNSGVSAVGFPTSINSQEHHYAYLGVTYTTPPLRGFLNSTFALGLTGDAESVDHHIGALCTASASAAALCTVPGSVYYVDAYPGKTRYFETTQSVTWTLPIDPRHGTSFAINDRWGALNFYQNAAFPYRYASAMAYTLTKRFNPGFALVMRHADLHQLPQGAPFTYPNALHFGYWEVQGIVHLDLNQRH